MITRANKELSVDKWKGIIEKLRFILEEPNSEKQERLSYDVEYLSRCGYCHEFNNSLDCGCAECPLFADGYCENFTSPNVLFWQFDSAFIGRDYEHALRLAERMLARIQQEPLKEEW